MSVLYNDLQRKMLLKAAFFFASTRPLPVVEGLGWGLRAL